MTLIHLKLKNGGANVVIVAENLFSIEGLYSSGECVGSNLRSDLMGNYMAVKETPMQIAALICPVPT